MQIDRIIYPIETLGPGKRIVLWTIGCTKECFNCSNPELWAKNNKKDISVAKIYRYLATICANNEVEGITFTGGDPLEQAEELLALLPMCSRLVEDILIYTGFTLKELDDGLVEKMSPHIACLIDGRYIDAKNDNKSPLVGSTNQRLIFFKEGYRDIYKKYSLKGRIVHNLFYENRFISVGIPNNNA